MLYVHKVFMLHLVNDSDHLASVVDIDVFIEGQLKELVSLAKTGDNNANAPVEEALNVLAQIYSNVG